MAGMAIEPRPPAMWAFQDCHTSAIPLIQGMAGMAAQHPEASPGSPIVGVLGPSPAMPEALAPLPLPIAPKRYRSPTPATTES